MSLIGAKDMKVDYTVLKNNARTRNRFSGGIQKVRNF
jgi:hypothetical protein